MTILEPTIDRRLRPARPPTAAVLGLLAVAVAWGTSFVLVKSTVVTVPPASLVTWRFLLAAAALILLRPRAVLRLPSRSVATSAVLGLLLGTGFVLCTVGLQTTSVLVSAFVTGTTVVFAPLVAWVWFGRRPTARIGVAVLLATAGLAAVTMRGLALGPGAALILAAALLWAVHLVALERWTRPGEVYGSAVVQLTTAAGVAAVVAGAVNGGRPGPAPIPAASWFGLVVLGLGATAGAFLLLTWAQARVDATTAAVLLTLEPVSGALLGVALGDALTWPVVTGALALLAAAYLVVWPTAG